MGRESAVLALFALLLGFSVVHLVRSTQRLGKPGPTRQIVFGLCCGLLGALVAAVPYADVVPDAAEVPALVAVPVIGLALLGVLWSHRRARHVRPPWRQRRGLRPFPQAVLIAHPSERPLLDQPAVVTHAVVSEEPGIPDPDAEAETVAPTEPAPEPAAVRLPRRTPRPAQIGADGR